MSFLSSRLSELHCTFQWAGDFLLPLRTRCVRSPATEGRGYRLLPGAVLAALLVVIVTADAAAHAALESSTPATGDIVAEAPGQVTARFTEPLTPAAYFSGVTTRHGHRRIGR